MSASNDRPGSEAEIARLAHAIWESEGRPEGRHLEHWQRASAMIERGEGESHLPRPVQPGFEHAAPGMIPDMKQAGGDELREGPGGRFAQQLAEAPEDPRPDASAPAPAVGGEPAPLRSRRTSNAGSG
jgi:DUF2934 family protein